MGKINSITKQTDNRYVNLYNVKATSVHNTPVNYFVASRARDVESLKLVTRKNKPDGVIIYSIYGENFTKWSKVYVNDEKQDSTFLNNTRIDLDDTELKNGDKISVVQMGSSDTVFRKSDEYIYKDGKLTVQKGTGTDTTTSWVPQADGDK